MLEHKHDDCTGRWRPGPPIAQGQPYPARWPHHYQCTRCGGVHYNGPGVLAEAEAENRLGDVLAAVSMGVR